MTYITVAELPHIPPVRRKRRRQSREAFKSVLRTFRDARTALDKLKPSGGLGSDPLRGQARAPSGNWGRRGDQSLLAQP